MTTQNVAAATVAATTVTKETPVPSRKYEPTKRVGLSFRGKQRQITYDILMAANRAMTIAEIAKIAAEKGLYAVGGVEPSVRYHLHHLTKDGLTKVTNPTYTITVEPVAAVVVTK